jgi:hypothetical protein
MPGIGELMEGAMQQAPQPARHSMKRPRLQTNGGNPNRPLKNYLHCHCCVKNSLKMLIYET